MKINFNPLSSKFDYTANKASEISDFDTEVSNNTDVSANTSARHSAVTLGTNTATALSLSGQELSIADVFVQLAGDTMTGQLNISPTALGDEQAFIVMGRLQPTGNEWGVAIQPVLEPTTDISFLYGSLNSAILEQSSFDVGTAIGCQYQVKIQTGYTGSITNAVALNVINPNKIEASASLVNNTGIQVGDLSQGSSINRAIRTQVSSGTGKYNLYIDGTADNYIAGFTGFGISTPANFIDVSYLHSENFNPPKAINATDIWSPTQTLAGNAFPTVFQLTPHYNSSFDNSGFLTGFRSFTYVDSTGALSIRNVDLLCSNSSTATVSNMRDIVVRSITNSSGTVDEYEAVLVQNSTGATTNRGFVQQGAGMINYMHGSLLIGTTGVARTAFSVADDLTPYLNNAYDLGNATYKWDDVYATNGTIITSDLNKKDSIQDSPLGLDFINALRPVSFKWKDYTTTEEQEELLGYDEETNEPIFVPSTVETTHTHTRPHYGLIAQDVKQVMDDLEIDFAGYIENDEGKGLRYTEFIAPLIKAVQELSNRVQELENV